MSGLRMRYLAVCLAGAVLSASGAFAALIQVNLAGQVTNVQDSPFAGGATTDGVFVGDPVDAQLLYDDTTAQATGPYTTYELTSLLIVVPDATQGGSFSLIPVDLNSATRIVFNGPAFQGLILPNNVTGLDSVDAFDLNDLSFEAEGTNGPEFRFNLGVPVVEFPEPGLGPMLVVGSVGLAVLGRKRARS